MPHVVTRSCCGDASCVYACPVNCIHPTPDEPDFGTAEMLYIDPASCVDCGACVSACPVGAIKPHTELTSSELAFIDINAAFHTPPAPRPVQAPVTPIRRADPARGPLRVAIVGSGPAALYAADEVLKQDGAQVSVIERLPVPYGLVRSGVAPDHPDTRQVTKLFATIEAEEGFSYHLGVDVGRDVRLADLLAHHHAVIYATGASADRRLGIEGEDLPGSGTATAFVGWYNGHPDHADLAPDLDAERVVIVGNGNVALDVARILVTDPERLARTDIADHALEALRHSAVREVVVLARRGATQAAYTLPELTGLLARDDIEVVVDGDLCLDPETVRRRAAGELDATAELALQAVESLPPATLPRGSRRRIVLRFGAQPRRILGVDRVAGIEIERTQVRTEDGRAVAVPTGEVEQIEAGAVLRSVGYRGVAVADLPFDELTGTVPNALGRVEVPGVYVAGWIKRGPNGYIGTNKSCSAETVDKLVEDFNAGLLPAPTRPLKDFAALVRRARPDVVDGTGWRRIRRFEQAWGERDGRPARRLVDPARMREIASSSRASLPA
ncbi:ferredoxin--NADP+ reductase [Nocardioides massiliensis]|uniref:ferredoxin--NADP(+) reductase n=3 Tax=Nocardioides massiliensis TaxID=1325935 RepID=A0ABT9NNY1_9ACTN|nr:FAD-dependent oxidoreductase [Nocardioides massiliensis]MDP9822131.1 ferredoxin--NADP+ reductase [Nocardioides massiliensis]